MLPNWIIVGAPKAGTSSLFQWLADHPEVCGSKEKETYYFVDPGTHMYRRDRNFADHGLSGYEALFAPGGHSAQVVVEATPGYMYYETALRELPKLPSRPQFIFVLREPVAQIRSLHRYFQENWDWIPRDMGFAEFMDAVERGTSSFKGNELASHALGNADYLPHLRRWRGACGAERLHVFLFEDLTADPREFMRNVAGTMGIDRAFYDSYGFPVENGTYVVRNAALQGLNIRMRGLIPQGRMYEALRRMYRAANTRAAPKSAAEVDAEEQAAERRLSERYLPQVVMLEKEFGLDLSRWRAKLEARIAGVEVVDGPLATGAEATRADVRRGPL